MASNPATTEEPAAESGASDAVEDTPSAAEASAIIADTSPRSADYVMIDTAEATAPPGTVLDGTNNSNSDGAADGDGDGGGGGGGDDDDDDKAERYCRICYEGSRDGDPLFSPCMCKVSDAAQRARSMRAGKPNAMPARSTGSTRCTF